MSRRPPPLRPRPARRTPATITAALLLAAGGLAAAAGIARLATGQPPRPAIRLLRSVSTLSWSDATMIIASGIAAALGIVLLVCAIVPGKRDAADLLVPQGGEPAPATVEAAIGHKTLTHMVAARAQTLNGIDRIRVHGNTRVLQVHATTPTRYVDQVRQDLADTVAQTLTSTGIQRPPKTRLHVRQTR